ncbi:hypothetical protein [Streptomyces melanogenes]|uniref:hypothetical protein n=1 Tax=Streptomyces melanogenes TaxID=67326 RepID=UPI003796A2A1
MAARNDDIPVCQLYMSADGKDWRDVTPPLRSVDVEDHDRLTDKATIVFDDPGGALAHASFEGLTVRVALGWGDRTATIFEGVIAGHRVIATQDSQWLELTALDFTFRMTGHTPDPPRVWDNGERLSDVVRALVTRPENHIVAAQIEPTDDRRFDKKSPLRQANVNDWEFVLDLARRQNCLSFVEFDGHEQSRFSFVPIAKVVAARPVGELRYTCGGGHLLEFDYERVSAAAPPLRQESTVDPVSGHLVVEPAAAPEQRPALPPPAAAHLDPQHRRALESLTELAAVADARLTRPAERVAGAAADPAAAAARVVPDPTKRLGFSGRGVATGNVALRAKSMVTIKGVASWAEGDWYVTKANHVFTRAAGTGRARPGYYTKFTATR